MLNRKLICSTILVASGGVVAGFSYAESGVKNQKLEEIVITARKTQESMQDVPVTVTAISADTIEQYGIDNASELTNLVPNLTIQQGGSGSGGQVRLRGIGSSNISAAFDTAVSFNIDGLQSNYSRYMFAGMFDVAQIEVLKGPQSLYFGKSASAGVITLNSKNPGDEFEMGISTSYEFEEDSTEVEFFVSGPVTETLGARLALRWLDTDEIMKNTAGVQNAGGFSGNLNLGGGLIVDQFLAPGGSTPANKWRGEESMDARLTLVWEPSDNFSANLKVLRSRYENDGQAFMFDVDCLGSTGLAVVAPMPGLGALSPFPAGLDCNPTDHVVQIGDFNDTLKNSPKGTKPYDKTGVDSVSLTMDYDLTENLSLTSVTGFLKINNNGQDNLNYAETNVNGQLDADANRKNLSQEFRLSSSFGGTFDFTTGVYYQKRENFFKSNQQAFSTGLFLGPDAVTGNSWDWTKIHETDIDAWSAYVNFIFRPIDTVEVNLGARHSHEEHEQDITFPYMHYLLAAQGLFSSGTQINGLEFEDDDLTPEANVSWRVRDNITLFASYKTGFKSGGIDNSLLPIPSSTPFQDLLPFASETVDGYEVGMKSDLLDNTLRFNASAFFYTYEDLQTQEFDSIAFNFVTLNAGEVESKGLEIETLWLTPVEGLRLRGALAYTNSKYTDDFFVTGETNLIPGTRLENLKGTQIQGNSKWAGNIGFDYATPLTDSLVLDWGIFANYRSHYQTGVFTNTREQDSFWKIDSTLAVSSADGKWTLSLIGQNLTDEVTINTTISTRPGAAADAGGFKGKSVQVSHGRQVSLQFKYNFF